MFKTAQTISLITTFITAPPLKTPSNATRSLHCRVPFGRIIALETFTSPPSKSQNAYQRVCTLIALLSPEFPTVFTLPRRNVLGQFCAAQVVADRRAISIAQWGWPLITKVFVDIDEDFRIMAA